MLNTIDVTPTPEGLRHSVQLFEAQIKQSEQLIKVAEEWLEFVDMEQCVYVVPFGVPHLRGGIGGPARAGAAAHRAHA